jgi:hypothetical protein
MPQHITLSFPKENVSATAELLTDAAPETCRFVWLNLPVEGRTIHGMYSGAEIFVFVDPPTPVEAENLVNMPLPGEILYYYQENVYADSTEPFAEICVIYGRNVQLRGAGGIPTFASLFARMVGDWSEFAAVCKRVRYEGPKLLKITRSS